MSSGNVGEEDKVRQQIIKGNKHNYESQCELLRKLLAMASASLSGSNRISEVALGLQKEALNMTVKTGRMGAAAQAFVPISQDIITITRDFYTMTREFQILSHAFVLGGTSYLRQLRVKNIFCTAFSKVGMDKNPCFRNTIRRSGFSCEPMANYCVSIAHGMKDIIRKMRSSFYDMQIAATRLANSAVNGCYAANLAKVETQRLEDAMASDITPTLQGIYSRLDETLEEIRKIRNRFVQGEQILNSLK